jgi:hypothetical protein
VGRCISLCTVFSSCLFVYIAGGLFMNFDVQYYKGIPIKLIKRNYTNCAAKRFVINNTNQNVWIPNKHLLENGTIKPNENLDYIFRKAKNQLNYAGITQAIPGIKRTYVKEEVLCQEM